jgi:hypothetical protein
MKTIVKDKQYMRINDVDADLRVKAGWKYCPKSDWKTNVRDFGIPTPEEVEIAKAEKAAEKKAKREKKN